MFGQKLPNWTAHHTFLESRHPEVTKNLYYVLSTCQSQILFFFFLLQLMDYIGINGFSAFVLFIIMEDDIKLLSVLLWSLVKSNKNWLKLISRANTNFVDAKVILKEFQQNVSILLYSTWDTLIVNLLQMTSHLLSCWNKRYTSFWECLHMCYQNI